jgi:hypothetical protein
VIVDTASPTWGQDWGSVPDCHDKTGCNGILYRTNYFEPVKMKMVTDGSSNTFIVGENVPSADLHSAAFFSDGDWASCNMQLNYFPQDQSIEWLKENWYDVRGFRSRHPGAVLFAMVDGSVQSITEGIDHAVYRALSTRNGDEVVTIE